MDYHGINWKGPLPFYMTYPEYIAPNREKDMLKDMEYLQQMYPKDVRRFQKRISEMLDKADYEGSFVYDEYPDRYSLRSMAKTMLLVLQKEEEDAPTEDLVQVLLFDEIYKRRHRQQRGKRYF